jgi:hypothetical protein
MVSKALENRESSPRGRLADCRRCGRTEDQPTERGVRIIICAPELEILAHRILPVGRSGYSNRLVCKFGSHDARCIDQQQSDVPIKMVGRTRRHARMLSDQRDGHIPDIGRFQKRTR